MTFTDARNLAIEFGANLLRFDHNHPLAQCWIDRVAYLPTAAQRGPTELADAIAEANRYA